MVRKIGNGNIDRWLLYRFKGLRDLNSEKILRDCFLPIDHPAHRTIPLYIVSRKQVQ